MDLTTFPSEKPDFSAEYDRLTREYGLVDREPVPYVIPSGSLLLDAASGIGGYPGGRVVEIFGPESSGKTTLALHACVSAQSMGKTFAYLDPEAVLDERYFRTIGVQGARNVDWLHVTPETGEDTFSMLEELVDKGINLLVVDSVAAMTPKAEFDGEMGEAFMGLQARMMGQGLRKLTHRVYRSGSTVIFINQVRQKIGVQFGNPETTTGGNALKFYASMRLDIRQVGDPIEDKDGRQIGKFSKVTFKKNKCAVPFKTAMVPLRWGQGIAREIELFDVLVVEGLVDKKSSYYYYNGQLIGAGKQAAYDFIVQNGPELLNALKEKRHGLEEGRNE